MHFANGGVQVSDLLCLLGYDVNEFVDRVVEHDDGGLSPFQLLTVKLQLLYEHLVSGGGGHD